MQKYLFWSNYINLARHWILVNGKNLFISIELLIYIHLWNHLVCSCMVSTGINNMILTCFFFLWHAPSVVLMNERTCLDPIMETMSGTERRATNSQPSMTTLLCHMMLLHLLMWHNTRFIRFDDRLLIRLKSRPFQSTTCTFLCKFNFNSIHCQEYKYFFTWYCFM